jgi:hypothetical protein
MNFAKKSVPSETVKISELLAPSVDIDNHPTNRRTHP